METLIEQDLPGSSTVLITSVTDWLMLQALGDAEIEDVFEGCCQRLDAIGVPVSRGMVSFRTLHPLYASSVLYWRRGEDVHSTKTRHEDAFTSEEFQKSPIHHLLNSSTPFLRRRLRGPTAQLDFPVLEELQAQGASDYLAYKVAFSTEQEAGAGGDGIVGSWTTERPSGFTDPELLALMRVQSRLAVACKTKIQAGVTHNVLDAYLGRNAGDRVLGGQIRRGDSERIQSVVWYSDMRDSTPWADRLGPDGFLNLVNNYFECTAGAVIAEGGEVLRFIGDAVLAIFPIKPGGQSAHEAARCAVAAMYKAEQKLSDLNARQAVVGAEKVDFGLGLHVGELTFGNIGVPERLEFSVVGPVANEVARLESLSKPLGRRVLVSEAFAKLVSIEWEPMGEHALRGVSEQVKIFSPAKQGL